jgi:hypothetical protein
MYSIWQSFDFAVREKALDGTLTLLNSMYSSHPRVFGKYTKFDSTPQPERDAG